MVARAGFSKALTDAQRSAASAGSGDESSPGRKPGRIPRKKGLLNVAEAGEVLGVSPWTIRRWVSQGRVPFVKLGKAVRFDKEDLVKLIEQCKVKPGRFGLADDDAL